MPCTNKDQRLSICSSCPFLHWRLQGLRGLCCKWSQTGLGFTREYRQRDRESTREAGWCLLTPPYFPMMSEHITNWWVTAPNTANVCLCLSFSYFLKHTHTAALTVLDSATSGYKMMSASCVRVVYEVVCNPSNLSISMFMLNLLVRFSSLLLCRCTEFSRVIKVVQKRLCL